jgi:carbonic anhydrase
MRYRSRLRPELKDKFETVSNNPNVKIDYLFGKIISQNYIIVH